MPTHHCLSGIFVGGRSRRMLGTPKGLLQPPGSDQNLVERLAEKLVAAGLPRIVLVGDNESYRTLPYSVVADSPIGRGPMAGLLGLVEYAARFEYEFVLAVACDMPYLNEELLRQLHCKFPAAGALVPKREFLEPLCARYCVSTTLPHLQNLVSQGQYRMMSLLEKFGAGCVHLPVDFSNAETLKDWDAPSDLPAGVRVLGKPFCPGAK